MASHAKWQRLLLRFMILLLFSAFLLPITADSFSGQTLRRGSTGADVSELQGRLHDIGYYKGAIDGQFGPQTEAAVRAFQRNYGLAQVDGIVGAATRQMLVRATSGWTGNTGSGQGGGSLVGSASPFSENDITLMARAVYGEARGEIYEGQVAVAAVILNRLRDSAFPNTISGVIFQPRAFTAVDDGQMWLTPDETAYKAVRDAINGWDPSLNALYYFNPDTATSAWIWSRPQIKKIGRHIFCR